LVRIRIRKTVAKKRYVIVGTGPAGINAAGGLRSKDSEAEIYLIGQEPVYPYSPTILPYFISGKIKEKDLFLPGESYFSKHQIELIRGNGVVSVSPQEEKVYLRDSSSVDYNSLILAQGGKPIIPNIPGVKGRDPFVLRTLADAKRLKSKAQRSSKAIILGAGLIGMHTAQSLAEAGLSVRVIELMDQILPGYFDKKATAIIQKVYEAHRVRFFTSTLIEEVAFQKGDYVLSLKGGKRIGAPLLLVATGVAPNIDFLKGSGIEVDQGILVDQAMRTNIPNIFAAGDVVQMDSFWGGAKVNQPILIHAVDQGRMAAASAIGEKVSHVGHISTNLFHFFGHRGLSVGLISPNGKDRFQVHQTYVPSKDRYLKFVFDGDILVGVMGIDSDVDSGILLQMIQRRIPLNGNKKEFLRKPLEMGRKLMCQKWR
jgi:phenylglyoxylate dehydrogenase epsilon subunit